MKYRISLLCFALVWCMNAQAQLTYERSEIGIAKGAATHHHKYTVGDSTLIYEHRIAGTRKPSTTTDTITIDGAQRGDILDAFSRSFTEVDPEECIGVGEAHDGIRYKRTVRNSNATGREEVFSLKGANAQLEGLECLLAYEKLEQTIKSFAKK